jgi:DNA repair exonuclease SbcCD ATPase subunit
MEFDALQRKVQDLIARSNRVKQQKAEIQGTLKAKKQELSNLILEIKAAGYNPATIREDYEKSERELEALTLKFEQELQQAEGVLAEYQKR